MARSAWRAFTHNVKFRLNKIWLSVRFIPKAIGKVMDMVLPRAYVKGSGMDLAFNYVDSSSGTDIEQRTWFEIQFLDIYILSLHHYKQGNPGEKNSHIKICFFGVIAIINYKKNRDTGTKFVEWFFDPKMAVVLVATVIFIVMASVSVIAPASTVGGMIPIWAVATSKMTITQWLMSFRAFTAACEFLSASYQAIYGLSADPTRKIFGPFFHYRILLYIALLPAVMYDYHVFRFLLLSTVLMSTIDIARSKFGAVILQWPLTLFTLRLFSYGKKSFMRSIDRFHLFMFNWSFARSHFLERHELSMMKIIANGVREYSKWIEPSYRHPDAINMLPKHRVLDNLYSQTIYFLLTKDGNYAEVVEENIDTGCDNKTVLYEEPIQSKKAGSSEKTHDLNEKGEPKSAKWNPLADLIDWMIPRLYIKLLGFDVAFNYRERTETIDTHEQIWSRRLLEVQFLDVKLLSFYHEFNISKEEKSYFETTVLGYSMRFNYRLKQNSYELIEKSWKESRLDRKALVVIAMFISFLLLNRAMYVSETVLLGQMIPFWSGASILTMSYPDLLMSFSAFVASIEAMSGLYNVFSNQQFEANRFGALFHYRIWLYLLLVPVVIFDYHVVSFALLSASLISFADVIRSRFGVLIISYPILLFNGRFVSFGDERWLGKHADRFYAFVFDLSFSLYTPWLNDAVLYYSSMIGTNYRGVDTQDTMRKHTRFSSVIERRYDDKQLRDSKMWTEPKKNASIVMEDLDGDSFVPGVLENDQTTGTGNREAEHGHTEGLSRESSEGGAGMGPVDTDQKDDGAVYPWKDAVAFPYGDDTQSEADKGEYALNDGDSSGDDASSSLLVGGSMFNSNQGRPERETGSPGTHSRRNSVVGLMEGASPAAKQGR